jgi:general stress protein 26
MKVCQKYIRLHDKIKNIKTAMLTFMNQDACLYSIPVNTLMTECEGHAWFFINLDSKMEDSLARGNCVNISYSDPVHRLFVSIIGEAEIIRDHNKFQEHWKPVFKDWFPLGLEDPELVLLRVNMKEAAYWDVNTAKMKNLWDFKEAVEVGEQNHNIEH